MRNDTKFIDYLNDAVLIRKELNEVHHKKMGKYALSFEYLTGEFRQSFKWVKDMLYYKGGWPSENTPPKLQTSIKKIASISKILKYLDLDDELNTYCEQYGIEINVLAPLDETVFNKDKCINSLIKLNLFTSEIIERIKTLNVKEIMKILITNGVELQAVICARADDIKENIGYNVKNDCDIEKNIFSSIVNIKNIHNENTQLGTKQINNNLNKISQIKDSLDLAFDESRNI